MPFTPDAALDLLFPADLISADVQSQLPPDLHMRPLAASDHARGHLAVLAVLTLAPDPGAAAWAAQFAALRAAPGTYFPLVVVERASDAIVAAGSAVVERKFLRGLGCVAHIEDIAVAPRMQGRRLGLRVVRALMHLAEGAGCYKTILNCSEENIGFYEKCGFERKEVEMVKYAPERPRL